MAGLYGPPGAPPRRQGALSEAEREMILRSEWPVELFEDPSRQPRYIETAEEFLRELMLGEHVEDLLILPNGVEKLDLRLGDTVPGEVRAALEGCDSVPDFLARLRGAPETLQKFKANIEWVDGGKQQRGVLPNEKQDLGRRIEEVLRIVDEGKVDPRKLYVSEMRHRTEVLHPQAAGEKVKTLCLRDVKDVLGPYAAWSLYWDRYDEGFFAGTRLSGKGLHVDHVLWSNVGKNWRGYKAVAAWPKGEVSKRMTEDFYDTLFHPPLAERETAALGQAAKVALLRPGDVYVFCGGIAHATLCVSEDMCLGAYEAFVSLSPAHVQHFLHTGDRTGPFALEKLCMSREEAKEIKDDMLDQLEDIADQLEKGGPAAVSAAVPDARPRVWRELQAGLHADSEVQARLRQYFARAVDSCLVDSHMGRRIPQFVLEAAEGCGSVRARKRRKTSEPFDDEGETASGRSSSHSSSSSATGGRSV